MGRSENYKAVVVVVACGFGGWVEVASGGDETGEVACATAGACNAAGEFSVEAE